MLKTGMYFCAMKREIKITQDGSPTLFVPELDEHYHSIHGARQESEHVFIHWGLKQFEHFAELSILEIGFGTGLNALLTVFHRPANQLIHYVGIEPFPVEADLVDAYAQSFSNESEVDTFKLLHESEWGSLKTILAGFKLEKQQVKLEDFSSTKQFDLIYFDAFGPRAQGELWTLTVFQQLFVLTKVGGRLVTYCAKGQVKRDMKAAGFNVISVPGPPGKREMTIALKD